MRCGEEAALLSASAPGVGQLARSSCGCSGDGQASWTRRVRSTPQTARARIARSLDRARVGRGGPQLLWRRGSWSPGRASPLSRPGPDLTRRALMTQTLIFRLSDEDELDAPASVEDSFLATSSSVATDRLGRARGGRLSGADQQTDLDHESPVLAHQDPRGRFAVEETEHRSHLDDARGFADVLLEVDPCDGEYLEGSSALNSSRPGEGRSLTRAAVRPWVVRRGLAIAGLVGVVLLAVGFAHGGRHAGRGSTQQRPLVAAAAEAQDASLPAGAASSRRGRWPTSPPRSPAAHHLARSHSAHRPPRRRAAMAARRRRVAGPRGAPDAAAVEPTRPTNSGEVSVLAAPPEPPVDARGAPATSSSSSTPPAAEFGFER
jgi:hypothetical protein